MKFLDTPIVKGSMVLTMKTGFICPCMSDVDAGTHNLLRDVFTQLGGTLEPYVPPMVDGKPFQGWAHIQLDELEQEAYNQLSKRIGHTKLLKLQKRVSLNKIRAASGMGLMDCKKALKWANGDVAKAPAYFLTQEFRGNKMF